MKHPLIHSVTIFLILIILTFSTVGVTPVKANSVPALIGISYTFNVNSTLDLPDDLTQPGTCHTAANTCTLRAAIMQANRVGYVDSVTIYVPSGHYILTPPASPADGDESGDLNLTTPTVYSTNYHIVGAGAATTIIDANSYDRVLRVHSGRSVDISGVTIQNGYLPTVYNWGCGIFNEGFLNLSDVVITNNHCAGYGGGISNVNQLGVSGSVINQNTSSLGGGGIDESGSYLSIENSTISGNSSTGSNGGGILSGGAAIKISNSTISNNSAYGSGGGIYNSSQNLVLINSTLTGNLANFNGGAILNKSTGQVNVYNSTIAFNGADWDADINGGQAGGVYNTGAFNMRNTLLAGNSVSGAPVYDDCSGTISSYGRNLIGAPYDTTSGNCAVYTGTGTWAQLNDLNLLGILQDNGGPTKTVALLAGSNAIDGADPVLGCINSSNVVLPADQRGLPRTAGVRCDIGAYEFSDYTSSLAATSKWTSDFSYTQGWRTDLHPRTNGDVNGDGKDDLVGFGYGGIFVSLSNGTQFLPVSKWSGDYSYDQGWRIELHPRMVGDVNGDGKEDVVGYGTGGAWVALSDGSKFMAVSKWTSDFSYAQGWRTDLHPRAVGDMNGDGKDDLIGFGYGGIFVSLSDGTQFLPVAKWSGDYSYDQGWRIELHPRMVGDVNGDGKDDVVGYGSGGVWVALSDGSKFLAVSSWTSDFSYAQGWRTDLHPRVVGDMNGDGKDDLVGFGYGGVFVSLSDGAKFLPVSKWSGDYSYDQGWRIGLHPRMVGDMNGDLKEDVVGYGTGGAWIALEQ